MAYEEIQLEESTAASSGYQPRVYDQPTAPLLSAGMEFFLFSILSFFANFVPVLPIFNPLLCQNFVPSGEV
jgi:hypothetical protein